VATGLVVKSSANFQIADGFVLGDWEVSPSSGELRSGDRLVRISPKVMDVLVHLATHADRVVSRDELISAVWVADPISAQTSARAW